MKKFITIALAVAVLFSFAACQAEYKQVTGVTVSYNGNGVLVGQTLDQSQFSGTVTYLSAPDAVYNGGYVVEGTTDNIYKPGVNKVIPTLNTATDSPVVVTGANVIAYYPTEIIVDTTGAATSVNQSAGWILVPTEGVVVTAVYNNGQEMELDASYIKASIDASQKGKDKAVGVALAESWGTAWKGHLPEVKSDWTVEIVEEKNPTLTALTIAPAKTLYINQVADDSDWIVTGTYSDNTTKELTADDYEVKYTEGTATAASTTTYNVVGQDVVKAYVQIGKIVSNLVSADVSDYVGSVAIVADNKGTALPSGGIEYSTKSMTPAAALNAINAMVETTMKDSGEKSYNAVSSKIEFNVAYLDNNSTTGQQVTWTFVQDEGAPTISATGTITFKYVAPKA